jgi:hypothetical protein
VTGPLRHDGRVRRAEFSVDHKQVLTASHGGACIWDVQSGELIRKFGDDRSV